MCGNTNRQRAAIALAMSAVTLLAVCAGVARAQQAAERGPGWQDQDQEFQPSGDSTGQPSGMMWPPPSLPSPSVPAEPTQGDPGAGAYDQPDDGSYGTTLIPPNVEGDAFAVEAGAYCYVGPHPVDTRVVPGASWDDTQGQHLRPYAPIDTRLFSFRDGCYYFTGDPRDFGYTGQSYSYYGAHPILDSYGGGWCFMMGGHTHVWAPWSPYFTVVGSWNYWYGPYDPFFWAFWPYYSFYYRSYYPNYYGGGRFYRGGGYRVAPPIHSLPASARRGGAPVRGNPAAQMYRNSPGPVRGTPPAQMYRGSPATAPPRGLPPAPMNRSSPLIAPTARPSFSPPPRAVMPSRGADFGSHGGGFRGGHR